MNYLIEEIKVDIENGDTSTLERIVAIYEYNKNYEVNKLKYDTNCVKYQIETIEDLKKIFGYDVNSIDGYGSLTLAHKEIFIKSLIKLINRFGISSRYELLIKKVELEPKNKRFKVYTIIPNKFYYFGFNGNIY